MGFLKNTILIFICYFLSHGLAHSQCLNTVSSSSNKGGYFDEDDLNTYWYSTKSGQSSTFTIDTSDYYYADIGAGTPGALKVSVSSNDDYLNNNVRMWSRNNQCPITIGTGEFWNVSFYVKGEIGQELQFVLIDGTSYGTSLGENNYKIRYKGWHYVRLKLTATGNGSSNSGRLRINFKSPGTYLLDNIVLEKDTNNSDFTTWYVDDGSNGSGTLESPFNSLKNAILNNTNYKTGDLVYVRSGTYQNSNYDGDNDASYANNQSSGTDDNAPYLNIGSTTKYDADGNGTNNGDTQVFLNDKNGTVNRPIVIRNYVDSDEIHETPLIQFDGKGGFVLGSSSTAIQHIEIAGFKIQGPNQNITYAEANLNRTMAIANRASAGSGSAGTSTYRNFYHGRGIAIWGGYYLNLHNNEVYDCPNSGIRLNNSDYARISYNTVYNNTWWSYNGESGIVIAQSLNRDADNTNTKIKMRIENNVTYANINKLVYYNPSYACEDGSGNYDTTLDSYACGGRNKIVDGSGCYITRNAWDSDDSGGSNPNYFTNVSGSSRVESGDNKYYGTFLFANNVSYANGMNGVVVHKTDYANVYNNTVYGNGEVPSTGDPDWGSYSDAWKSALGAGRQNYSGIVVHSSSNVNVLNNISEARFNNDTAYVNYVESGWEVENVSFGSSKNLAGTTGNVSGGNQSLNSSDFTEANPQFVDANNNTLSSRDYSLSIGSPAIDHVASDQSYESDFDISGVSRPQGNGFDMGAYERLNTWDGSESSAWTTANNWSAGVVPTSGRSPLIVNASNAPEITSAVNIKDLTINSGGSLTIGTNGSLNINGTLTNSGSMTINGTVNID